jgi:hypothetical protein
MAPCTEEYQEGELAQKHALPAPKPEKRVQSKRITTPLSIARSRNGIDVFCAWQIPTFWSIWSRAMDCPTHRTSAGRLSGFGSHSWPTDFGDQPDLWKPVRNDELGVAVSAEEFDLGSRRATAEEYLSPFLRQFRKSLQNRMLLLSAGVSRGAIHGLPMGKTTIH